MSEFARTGVFVGVAVVSVGLAYALAPSTELKPQAILDARLGEEFYPDFKDPNEPTSLTVVSFDEKRATAKPFSVQLKDGVWTIPSHHNYPADGAERLAKTSASSIGIERAELRSSRPEDYVELGVVDPLDQDAQKLKGRGQRITLKKGDAVVMDLIIGKQVRNRPGFYYVRKPDERSTYVAKIDIDLSTKFADWVETDLLKIDRDDLRTVTMNNYSIDEAAGRIVDGDVVEIDRPKAGDPWKLKGLDDKTEELETAKINDLVNTLDDLKLTGIRPKPEGLSEDLKLNQGIQLDPVTRMDLQSRGYFIVQGQLLSNEGQMDATTDKGVVYTLRFGEIFAGDDLAVEAGLEADKKAADAAQKKEGDDAKKDETLPEGPKANRYLFVTAYFDEKLLGPKPVKPTAPDEPAKPGEDEKKEAAPKAEDKPAETKEEAKPEEKKEEPPADEKKPEEKKEEQGALKAARSTLVATTENGLAVALAQQEAEAKKEDSKPEEPASDKPEAAGKEDEKKPAEAPATDDEAAKKAAEKAADAALRAAEEAQDKYEEDLKKYEADLKQYEEKVKAGKEQVAKLNRRFADWYYVISAESYNKLHVARKDVVKSKTPVVDNPAAPPGTPALDAPKAEPKPEQPAPEAPKGEDKPKAEPKPETEPKPEAEPKKEEAPKDEAPKEDAPKADEKPAEKAQE